MQLPVDAGRSVQDLSVAIPFPDTFCAFLDLHGRASTKLPQNKKGPNAYTFKPLCLTTFRRLQVKIILVV